MVVHSLYTYEENFGNCFGYLALGNYCVTYQLFPNTSSCTLHPYVFVITGLLFALFVLPMFLLLRFCSVIMFFVLFILCNFSVLYNVVLLSQIHIMVFLPHFCSVSLFVHSSPDFVFIVSLSVVLLIQGILTFYQSCTSCTKILIYCTLLR